MQQHTWWTCKIVQSSLGITTWNNSNRSFSRTRRWSFTAKRQLPSQHMQSGNETCQCAAPGSCASQALPSVTCRKIQNHRITPTVPSQHFSYTTHWCQHRAAIPMCHGSSPASCGFSTGLSQNQRQHLLPGISKWQEGKIVLGLLQTSNWCVCSSDPCGSRKKGKDPKKESWGKMRGQDRLLKDPREGDVAG